MCDYTTPPTGSLDLSIYDGYVYDTFTDVSCGVELAPQDVDHGSVYSMALNLTNDSGVDVTIRKSDIEFESTEGFSYFYQYGGSINVTGAGSTVVNGLYTFMGYMNGFPYYYNEDANLWIYWEPEIAQGGPGYWSLYHDLSAVYYRSDEKVAQPDQVTTWVAGNIGVNPVPTFAEVGIQADGYGPDEITIAPGGVFKTVVKYDPDVYPASAVVAASILLPRNLVSTCGASVSFTAVSGDPGPGPDPDPVNYELWFRDFEVISEYQQISCGFHYTTPTAYTSYYFDLDVRNTGDTPIVLPKSGILLEAGAEPGFLLKYFAGGTIEISGSGSPEIHGIYHCGYASDGKSYYYNDDLGMYIDWITTGTGGYWLIHNYVNEWYRSSEDTSDPIYVTNWTVSPAAENLGVLPAPQLSGTPANTYESGEADLTINPGSKAIISVEWTPDTPVDHEVPFAIVIPVGEDGCEVSATVIAPNTPTECTYETPSNFAPFKTGLLQGFALRDYDDDLWFNTINSLSAGPAYMIRNASMSDNGRYILMGGITPDWTDSKWCVIEKTDDGFVTHEINMTGIVNLVLLSDFNNDDSPHKITRDGKMVARVKLPGGGTGSACWYNGFDNPPDVNEISTYYMWITDGGFTLGWDDDGQIIRVDLSTGIEDIIDITADAPACCGNHCMTRFIAWSDTDPEGRQTLFERDESGTWIEQPGAFVAHNVGPEVEYPRIVDMSGDGSMVVGFDAYGYEKALLWRLDEGPEDGYYQAQVLPAPSPEYGEAGEPESISSDGSVIGGRTSYGYPCFWTKGDNFANCHVLESFMSDHTSGPQEVQKFWESIPNAYTVYGNLHVGAEGRHFIVFGEKNNQYIPGLFPDAVMYCAPTVILSKHNAPPEHLVMEFDPSIVYDYENSDTQYFYGNVTGGLYGWALWVMETDTIRWLVHFEPYPDIGTFNLSQYLSGAAITDLPGAGGSLRRRLLFTVVTVGSGGLELQSEQPTNITIISDGIGNASVGNYTNMHAGYEIAYDYTWYEIHRSSDNGFIAYVNNGQYLDLEDYTNCNVRISLSNAMPTLPIPE